MCRTWSETPYTGFLTTRHNSYNNVTVAISELLNCLMFLNHFYVFIFLDHIQVSSGKWICNTAEIRDIVVSLSVVIASISIQWNNSDNADNRL